MTMRSGLRSMLRRALERALRPSGYSLIRPDSRFGIDVIVDLTRLSRLWKVDLGLVFDVGANVGASALAFRAAWPGCRVVAFEPNAAVARELAANVEAIGGVSVEEVALGSRSGRADFFVHEDATVLGSLQARTPYTERFGLQGRPVGVSVATLDGFCDEHAIARVNLLKIDAEGSDHDVLLGAERMLSDGRIDFVYCEFNSLGPEAGRVGSLVPIASLLGGHGFEFIASYNDYIVTEGPFFSVSNALFAAARGRS